MCMYAYLCVNTCRRKRKRKRKRNSNSNNFLTKKKRCSPSPHPFIHTHFHLDGHNISHIKSYPIISYQINFTTLLLSHETKNPSLSHIPSFYPISITQHIIALHCISSSPNHQSALCSPPAPHGSLSLSLSSMHNPTTQ